MSLLQKDILVPPFVDGPGGTPLQVCQESKFSQKLYGVFETHTKNSDSRAQIYLQSFKLLSSKDIVSIWFIGVCWSVGVCECVSVCVCVCV